MSGDFVFDSLALLGVFEHFCNALVAHKTKELKELGGLSCHAYGKLFWRVIFAPVACITKVPDMFRHGIELIHRPQPP